MNAAIISIGNELLSGHQNTNAAWIGQLLTSNSISVSEIFTIADEKKAILKTIESALKDAEIVIITGGLGPTKDDITKNSLCQYFNCGIRFCESTYKNIEKIFKDRGYTVTLVNKKQAEVPEIAKAIPNLQGTAPGLWFDIEEKTLVAMPGVPFEMKSMFENFILPQLKSKHHLPVIISKTILTQGIGESFLADLIADWEKNIPSNVKLAYLPSPGIVKLRLTGVDENGKDLQNTIDNLVSALQLIIPEYIYGYDNQKLEDIIGALLVEKNATLCTAESCTGGYLSHLITSCQGSSEYYKGSVIAYSNEIKSSILHIDTSIIEAHGAVSEEVVKAMAVNARDTLKTTYSIAITGIAGPGGGTEFKSVGTVWIAVASPIDVKARMFLFGENRMVNISRSAITALNMLRKELVK